MTPSPEDRRWTLTRLLKALRHPARLLLLLGGVVAATAPLGSILISSFASLGAILGLILGELLGRSPLRLHTLLGLAAVAVASALLVGWGLTGPALVSTIIGPVLALQAATALAAFTTAALPACGLRAMAVRSPAVAIVELGALTSLYVVLVMTHRDGAISRPLWLSDLTWTFGLDPGHVLLAFGAVLALTLALLLLLEARQRLPGLGLLWVPTLLIASILIGLWIGQSEEPLPDRLLQLSEDGEDIASTEEESRDRVASGSSDGLLDGEADADSTPDERGGQTGQDPQDETDASERPDRGRPEEGGDPEAGDRPATPDDGQSEAQGGSDSDPSGPEAPSDGGESSDESDPEEQESPQGGAQDSEDESDQASSSSDQAPDPLDEQEQGGADRPVAVVLIEDDYIPPSGYWYFRQEALSRYTGPRLLPATSDGLNPDTPTRFPVFETPIAGAPAPDGRAVVHGSVTLVVQHETPFALESPAVLAPRGNPNPARFVRSYSFVSRATTLDFGDLLDRGVGDPDWSAEVWQHYLELPADRRYSELAREWIEELPEPARDNQVAQALIIAHHLGESMKYTLKARYPDSADPTAAFLFGPRIGYCVHSAHAATYLWRSQGIPARVATGYAVNEDERRGSSIVIKGSQAHAWPEIYLQGLGWVPLDIAPSEDLDDGGDPMPEDEIALLAEMARDPPPPELETRLDLSWIWRPLGIALATMLTILGVIVLSLHYALKLWRLLAPALSSSRGLPRRGYRAALDRLCEVGLTRREGESRESFARRVEHHAPSFREITSLHLRGAFGPPDKPGPERQSSVWADALQRLRRELRANQPWWRRLLGRIDPSTLYRAR